ncbi:MAE_28990/MAE_18760 family HEPN-like nuclease [Desulfonema magnum]|uniref:HEPN domain-containing protein n=1 Tax=Desulfonema magnum TaxID=45655 RepID=A0A975BGP3_9BACT|nr:MAE_28990/MAE_18760 family HEPN-like nuclease [Desulfonema magnum]QTA84983.1 HEPN domain-containing protein [Desulfonema magnum]
MSKKNLSVNSLYDNIENDFSWRHKELHIFSKRIPIENNAYQRVLLRAGITLLYAHWEGFVLSSASDYLQHISMQGLSHKDLQPQFVALCLKTKIERLSVNKLETMAEVIVFLNEEMNRKAYVPYKKVINTKANLGFEALREIFFTIGLDIGSIRFKRGRN